MPAIIRGLTIHPDNALAFDFIVDQGDSQLKGEEFSEEAKKLIKYFLAALTVPKEDMWVNLSPYEEDRIIPDGFGDTKMGRDMLAQDYMLKQLSASLMYPEDELGKKFWDRIYAKAKDKFGISDIPAETFNKVWIVPQKAVVYEKDSSVFVLESHLKVMMEEDYVALNEHKGNSIFGLDSLSEKKASEVSKISSEMIRDLLIPEIEKEVNEGEVFANLRQIFNSIILAQWYKENLKESLLGQVYVDQEKTKGVDTEDKEINQKIYDQYVEAFKKGVYQYIKEDYDAETQETIPRKYFSGGTTASPLVLQYYDGALALNMYDLLQGSRVFSFGINVIGIPKGDQPQEVEDILKAMVASNDKTIGVEEKFLASSPVNGQELIGLHRNKFVELGSQIEFSDPPIFQKNNNGGENFTLVSAFETSLEKKQLLEGLDLYFHWGYLGAPENTWRDDLAKLFVTEQGEYEIRLDVNPKSIQFDVERPVVLGATVFMVPKGVFPNKSFASGRKEFKDKHIRWASQTPGDLDARRYFPAREVPELTVNRLDKEGLKKIFYLIDPLIHKSMKDLIDKNDLNYLSIERSDPDINELLQIADVQMQASDQGIALPVALVTVEDDSSSILVLRGINENVDILDMDPSKFAFHKEIKAYRSKAHVHMKKIGELFGKLHKLKVRSGILRSLGSLIAISKKGAFLIDFSSAEGGVSERSLLEEVFKFEEKVLASFEFVGFWVVAEGKALLRTFFRTYVQTRFLNELDGKPIDEVDDFIKELRNQLKFSQIDKKEAIREISKKPNIKIIQNTKALKSEIKGLEVSFNILADPALIDISDIYFREGHNVGGRDFKASFVGEDGEYQVKVFIPRDELISKNPKGVEHKFGFTAFLIPKGMNLDMAIKQKNMEWLTDYGLLSGIIFLQGIMDVSNKQQEPKEDVENPTSFLKPAQNYWSFNLVNGFWGLGDIENLKHISRAIGQKHKQGYRLNSIPQLDDSKTVHFKDYAEIDLHAPMSIVKGINNVRYVWESSSKLRLASDWERFEEILLFAQAVSKGLVYFGHISSKEQEDDIKQLILKSYAQGRGAQKGEEDNFISMLWQVFNFSQKKNLLIKFPKTVRPGISKKYEINHFLNASAEVEKMIDIYVHWGPRDGSIKWVTEKFSEDEINKPKGTAGSIFFKKRLDPRERFQNKRGDFAATIVVMPKGVEPSEINLKDDHLTKWLEYDKPFVVASSPLQADLPVELDTSVAVQQQGGINFNTDLIDWQIKRDGLGIPLPVSLQPMQSIQIDGFIPVIINVIPVSLPLLLGLNNPVCPEGDENGEDCSNKIEPMARLEDWIFRKDKDK